MEPNSIYEFLRMGRHWVLEVVGQPSTYCGIGVCDPILGQHISALSPFRYSTCLFQWVASADVPAGNGFDLTLARGTSAELFAAGVDESGASQGIWWVLTTADTDLTAGGAPIDRGLKFCSTGMTVECPDTFQRGYPGNTATDPREVPAALRSQPDGPQYNQTIIKAMINYTAFELRFGNQGCFHRVGLAADWPHWGGPSGEAATRIGLTSMPGAYLPFMASVCLGSVDEVKQLRITARFGHAYVVDNDPTAPLPEPNNNVADEGELFSAAHVYAPVRVHMVGYICCVPDLALCGIIPDPATLARIAAAAANQQAITPMPPTPGYVPG